MTKRKRHNRTLLPFERFLLDFANAKSSEIAFEILKNYVGTKFNIIVQKDRDQKDRDQKAIIGPYNQLKKFFVELSKTTNLWRCPTIHDYTAQYYMNNLTPLIDIQEDGRLGEYSPIEDESVFYSDIITYYIIKFLKDEDNIELFFKCKNPYCGNFFIAKRANPKRRARKNKFCSDKCRFKWHDNKRKKKPAKSKQATSIYSNPNKAKPT